ncbi:MAG: hypothetical protein IT445_12810 [Phycisphaeraceae bacterium]|nr:hypothetical protein [Phycisphaeraceae bacterium]
MKRVVCLIVVALLTACQFKGEPSQGDGGQGDTETRGRGDSNSGGRRGWESRPVAMRVYPTTRFVKQGEQAVLEARVELFDEMGDSVKGAGEMRLELRDAAPGNRGGAEAILYTWTVSLMTLEDQQRYYDPVTRCYLFHLKLEELPAAKRNPVLSLFYTMTDNQRFTAEAPVKTDWGESQK